MYKDLFNVEKQKLMKSLARILGVLLLISLVLTIFFWITKNNFLAWQGLMTIGLSFAWFIPFAWSVNSLSAQRLKKYVDENPSNDPISIISNSYLKGDLEELFKKAGFPKFHYGVHVDKHGNAEFGFIIIFKKKQFTVEFEQNIWKWFVGDSKIEEQDIKDDQWILFNLSSQNVNSIDDIIAIIKRLYDSTDIQE